MSKLKKAVATLREEGMMPLFYKIYSYYDYKTRYNPEYIISRMMGARKISVGGLEMKVKISNVGAYNEMKFITRHEQEVINDILGEIREEDVFLDIGANMGVHSIFADKKAETVYSIEPHPANSSHLSINSKINDSDINMFLCGFSDVQRYARMVSVGKSIQVDGSTSIEGEERTNGEDLISVKLERGDEFLKQNDLKTPNIVKIDVEGAEQSVLRGLEGVLTSPQCKVVYCEVHNRNEFDEIKSILSSFGFSTGVIENGRMIKATGK